MQKISKIMHPNTSSYLYGAVWLYKVTNMNTVCSTQKQIALSTLYTVYVSIFVFSLGPVLLLLTSFAAMLRVTMFWWVLALWMWLKDSRPINSCPFVSQYENCSMLCLRLNDAIVLCFTANDVIVVQLGRRHRQRRYSCLRCWSSSTNTRSMWSRRHHLDAVRSYADCGDQSGDADGAPARRTLATRRWTVTGVAWRK